MKTETVSIGPVRIPKEHKEGLDQLKQGKAHITYSDLIREAIYLLLVKNEIIKDEKYIT
jgi:Arc/MetJ-type ribon-helix-helix transcriptional regulator